MIFYITLWTLELFPHPGRGLTVWNVTLIIKAGFVAKTYNSQPFIHRRTTFKIKERKRNALLEEMQNSTDERTLKKCCSDLSLPPRHWNTGLVSSGVSLTSWGEGASLPLVGHPSSDGFTIKITYGVDVLLHRPASQLIFYYCVG